MRVKLENPFVFVIVLIFFRNMHSDFIHLKDPDH